MWSPSRRSLLQRLVALLPSWPLSGLLLASTEPRDSRAGTTLGGVAEVVLPLAELGASGIARAVEDFESWSAGFVPEAELDHPYLWSDELRHGPADPRSRWQAQLEALDSAARQSGVGGFAELPIGERRRLLESQLPSALPERLDDPAAIEHVAVALLARFLSTPDANDLCYRAAIGRYSCRGLPSVGSEPAPLEVERG